MVPYISKHIDWWKMHEMSWCVAYVSSKGGTNHLTCRVSECHLSKIIYFQQNVLYFCFTFSSSHQFKREIHKNSSHSRFLNYLQYYFHSTWLINVPTVDHCIVLFCNQTRINDFNTTSYTEFVNLFKQNISCKNMIT